MVRVNFWLELDGVLVEIESLKFLAQVGQGIFLKRCLVNGSFDRKFVLKIAEKLKKNLTCVKKWYIHIVCAFCVQI